MISLEIGSGFRFFWNQEEYENIDLNARNKRSEFDEVFHQQMTAKQS